MTHIHILGAAAASAALIAFLNSPPAQKDMMSYLGFMEHGIFTLAQNLHNNVGAMVDHKPIQGVVMTPPNISTQENTINSDNATQKKHGGNSTVQNSTYRK